ncbi:MULTISPECIES: TetR/AcrR family transcriptional regulator [Microbacterium]|jgi:AcrR family transcriptional regulator|uniref:TetR/AcrR family transcriptional regulator n=1 Tax=Microbacterium TaxID=33882 RepID=UPI001E52AECD|nr:TetR/AcrR family transcriptional regulator [Microbacterium nymphoidis]MCD2497697.1 TetR/AcrR family transcriptional regulator [Microbacterium nymphoidis]
MSTPRQSTADVSSVVAAALTLFEEQGFEQTSVDQIAKAAGVSRSTFFRQFGGKDDVVFADHEYVLAEARAFLDDRHENPWVAVTDGAMLVFKHFTSDIDVARKRYELVRRIPALREREIVTVFRYERLFDEYLRSALPGLDPVDAVGFAAVVAAVHNHVLRQMLRGRKVPAATLRAALDDALHRFGVHPDGARAAEDDVVVAVFPRSMPMAEVTRRVQAQIG